MKISFSFCFFLLSLYSFSQDTIYLDKTKNEVDKNQAEYFRIVYKGTKVTDLVIRDTYYITGQKESEDYTLFDPINKVEDTISFWYTKSWYKNRKPKSFIAHRYGKLSDTLKTFWKNSTLKRKDFYKDGKLISGHCYDSLGTEIKHFDYEIMPQYPGGYSKLLSTIGEKMEMPDFIRDNGLKIRVIVKFVIDENGNATNISMLQGYNKEVDDAAIKVIGQLKKFKPAMIDGVPTRINYMIPISLSAIY